MSSIELTFLLCLLALCWYWLDGLRAKEIATIAGKRLCRKQGVYFLDETVVLTRIRPRRNATGQVAFYREYHFEFTSDGDYRYKGSVHLLGKYVVATDMEPYRQPPDL